MSVAGLWVRLVVLLARLGYGKLRRAGRRCGRAETAHYLDTKEKAGNQVYLASGLISLRRTKCYAVAGAAGGVCFAANAISMAGFTRLTTSSSVLVPASART